MSIIGDALQRAEREGAPLDAPKPAVAVPQRPVLDVRVATPPKAVSSPRRKAQPAPVRARPRVSAATVVLFVLAILTVYMLADPRWSGSNWGVDQFWVPSASVDALAPISAEAGPPPTMTASTLAGDSVALPAATIEALPAEPAAPAAAPAEPPAASAAEPDVTKRYALSGVMLGGSTRLAVINGAIVEVGQVIDGAEVVSISRRDVTLSISGRKVRIAMQAEGFKRHEQDGLNPPRRPGPG